MGELGDKIDEALKDKPKEEQKDIVEALSKIFNLDPPGTAKKESPSAEETAKEKPEEKKEVKEVPKKSPEVKKKNNKKKNKKKKEVAKKPEEETKKEVKKIEESWQMIVLGAVAVIGIAIAIIWSGKKDPTHIPVTGQIPDTHPIAFIKDLKAEEIHSLLIGSTPVTYITVPETLEQVKMPEGMTESDVRYIIDNYIKTGLLQAPPRK
jgi:hypothetical protein